MTDDQITPRFGFRLLNVLERLAGRALAFVLAHVIHVFRVTGRMSWDASRAVVLPPWDPGSLGDQAIVRGCISQLAEHSIEPRLLAYRRHARWDEPVPTIDLKTYFEGRETSGLLRFLRLIARSGYFLVLGADVMDGAYSEVDTIKRLRLARLAAIVGVDTRIVAFSYNASPAPSCVRAMKKLPSRVALTARDAASRERIHRYTARPVTLVADLAFMMQPASRSDVGMLVRDWWTEQGRDGDRVLVGINVNRQSRPEPESELVEAYLGAMKRLHEEKAGGVGFVIVPHDLRPNVGDIELSQQLFDLMPDELRTASLLLPATDDSAHIKEVCGLLDFVFTGRMHLGIAALGQGVPIGYISYQDKFDGLMAHFELEGLGLDAAEPLTAEGLRRLMDHAVEERLGLAQAVRDRLPRVKELARASLIP